MKDVDYFWENFVILYLLFKKRNSFFVLTSSQRRKTKIVNELNN